LITPDPLLNNKLIIDSILSNYDNGKCYDICNTEFHKKFTNDYEREIQRKLIKKINEEFTDDGINISFNIAKRTINKQDILNNQISEEVSSKEIMVLESYKPLNHITDYIKNKRDKYIKISCPSNDIYAIYSIASYNQSPLLYRYINFDSNKSFEGWFSPYKNKLVKHIENFNNKTGPYSMSTTQYKLGILLHGEPGCGKTSFIKILATETQRSIFPVSLDKLPNLEALKALFFSEYIYVDMGDGRHKFKYLPLNKRIIVFEEIDTAGEIVMDRQKIKDMMKNKSDCYGMSFYKNINKKMATIKKNSKDQKQSESNYPADNDNKSNKSDKSNKDNKNEQDNEDDFERMFDDAFKSKNNITLGDLLDLFDGICELNGLIYVMTTNYKNYLDKALIRPGRINLSIELGKIKKPEIIEMLEYYYVKNNCEIGKFMTEGDKFNMIVEIADRSDDKYKPSELDENCKRMSLIELNEFTLQ